MKKVHSFRLQYMGSVVKLAPSLPTVLSAAGVFFCDKTTTSSFMIRQNHVGTMNTQTQVT